MCMVCGFRATTKNKYRELQDHLVRQHFQDRIKSALPTRRPFMCPDEGCKVEGKDWQALMRHYTGKHGILEGYLKEVIASGQVSRGMKIMLKLVQNFITLFRGAWELNNNSYTFKFYSVQG